MEGYIKFIQTADQPTIDGWLDQIDTLFYTKGTPVMSDDEYNNLIDIYKSRFGPRKVIGAPAEKGDITLPIAMMSLDKVQKHEPKVLETWMKNNPGPYVAMDKVNGNSGLYEIKHNLDGSVTTKLYKRGDGIKGPDISRILLYLNLPILPFDVLVKGELVVDKEDYAPYRGDGKDQYKTNLSMSTGLLNPGNVDANPDHLKLIKFIAFDMTFPKNQNIELNMSQTLEHLTKYGFRVPFHIRTPTLTIDWLGQFYHRQKEHQSYDVDGIVIIANRPVKYSERLVKKNPTYGIAYKERGDIYETTVTNVIYEASKHGILTPVVHVVDTPIGDTGFTIRHPTGHNAKFIVDNNIGIGAVVQVIHNTVPKIIGTVKGKGATPTMPNPDKYPPGSWEWNETGVEIVLKNKDIPEVKIARLYEFFRKDKINAKGWGEKTVARLYYAGFDTLKKLLETDKAGFMAVPIEGVGERGIDNLIRSRDLALPQANIATIMAGSGMFDHGIGKRMIQKVIDVYPNILDINPTLDQILSIEGFADKKAEKFIAGLPRFKQFISNIPILQRATRGQLVKVGSPDTNQTKPGKSATIAPVGKLTGESLVGKVVVFTGFRDAQLEAAIKQAGGTVKSGGVTKKVDYVISDGPKGKGSSKETKAISYGIPTPDIATFKGMFGIA